MDRGILVEGSMNPHFVIVGGKLAKDPAQMRFTENDHLVNAFPSDRAGRNRRGTLARVGKVLNVPHL